MKTKRLSLSLKSIYKKIPILTKELIKSLKEDSIINTFKKTINYIKYEWGNTKDKNDYERWIERYDVYNEVEAKNEIKIFKLNPKISIIIPVYNIAPKWLDKCIESVVSQYYTNWEICLHDDCSTNSKTIKCLKKWEEKDERIKISYGKINQHISGASNDALKLATGEYIALMDNDDEISPNALYEVVKMINKNPKADFIYTDEDKLDMKGERCDYNFKPDWDPDLLRSCMYTCHFTIYKKDIVDMVGGFRKGYEGSQDYDLALRISEKTKEIYHIPKILYHWRKIPGSTAESTQAKNYARISGEKALQDHLNRMNIDAKAITTVSGYYRAKRKIIGNPLISIIIPFKDMPELLEKCINSIVEKSTYKNYEIIGISNNSEEKKTFKMMRKLESANITFYEYNVPFNYSKINNYAIKFTKGEHLILLNNDIEIISEGWIDAMLEHSQRKDVGAVGALLLYPNNKVQHAGVVAGLGGVAGHAFINFPKEDIRINSLTRNYSAVTAACMMVKKELYEKIGGLNEVDLKIAFNDTDFCLRLKEKGYINIYTPFAMLYHYESISRGYDLHGENKIRFSKEVEYMKKRHAKTLKDGDPYLNDNFSLDYDYPTLKI